VDGLQPHDLAVPLRLDDAQPANDWIFVDSHTVNAVVRDACVIQDFIPGFAWSLSCSNLFFW
jgi:hypothetical protein